MPAQPLGWTATRLPVTRMSMPWRARKRLSSTLPATSSRVSRTGLSLKTIRAPSVGARQRRLKVATTPVPVIGARGQNDGVVELPPRSGGSHRIALGQNSIAQGKPAEQRPRGEGRYTWRRRLGIHDLEEAVGDRKMQREPGSADSPEVGDDLKIDAIADVRLHARPR
jgi:hypothetical protein